MSTYVYKHVGPQIPLDKKLATNCVVETCTKFEELIQAVMILMLGNQDTVHTEMNFRPRRQAPTKCHYCNLIQNFD